MARAFLQITKESAYKVPMASPVRGTDQIVIRLSGANSYTPRPKHRKYKIMRGGGVAVVALSGADSTELTGKLTTELYAGQAAFLLGLCAQKINTAQTSPWVTTEPAGDLASVTIDFAIQHSDGTYKRRRNLGMKVGKWNLKCAREDANAVAMLDIDFVGSTPQGNTFDSSSDPDVTAFPTPLDSEYPTDPFLFSHTSGQLLIGGAARVFYGSVELDVTNVLDARYFASRFVQLIRCYGRDSRLKFKHMVMASPDDRATYEALTAQAASVEFNNGTHTAKIDFNGSNPFEGVDDDLPLDKLYEQGLELQNQWDSAAGADITPTFT